jgi:recombination DNA repair RAD52 pathway protein
MALTPEQQIELQTAIATAQEAVGVQESAKQRKLESVRIAHTTLLENKRNLPVEQRQITAAEITAFADSLNAYVNA